MTRKEKAEHRRKRKEQLETRIDELYSLYFKTKCIKERDALISEAHNLEIKLLHIDQEVVKSRYFGLKEVSSFNILKS